MPKQKDKTQYEAPLVQVVPARMEQYVICSSPLPGGHEDIGYDEDN